ncbi:hypothetical protein HRI_003037900 [Hibiscus trionum]|uniref:Uncharacterized protein n=1 Tax=Hibiscus trionum TaxID=183268 RepID=A0A9W7IEM0_HIBTR|nr:hypothetical protein HRI_003037900 [Hibiscus trionum]
MMHVGPRAALSSPIRLNETGSRCFLDLWKWCLNAFCTASLTVLKIQADVNSSCRPTSKNPKAAGELM